MEFKQVKKPKDNRFSPWSYCKKELKICTSPVRRKHKVSHPLTKDMENGKNLEHKFQSKSLL
jgi:hypothetical protein